MQRNKNKLFYSKYILKNRIKAQKEEFDIEIEQKIGNFKLIAGILRDNASKVENHLEEYKTKEQLYAMGFSAAQICKYFVYSNSELHKFHSFWELKPAVVINGKIIRSIGALADALSINVKIAV